MTTRRRGGFTLIELMITLVLVGVLATIALTYLWRSKDRAYVTTAQSDLRLVATYQEAYFGRHQRYAGAVSDLAPFEPSPGVSISITSADAGGWAGTSTHVSVASRQCGVFVGNALASGGAPATAPGQVACN